MSKKKELMIDKTQREKLDLSKFIILKEDEQRKKLTEILNLMYNEQIKIMPKHIDKILNICFDKNDDEVYLPKNLVVSKKDNELIFKYVTKSNYLLIILLIIGSILLISTATYFGFRKMASKYLNIDLNNDGIPDLNIDLDNDNYCDLNCDEDKDNKPDVNIDYKGNNKAIFNVLQKDGKYSNPINQDLNNDGMCDLNCDTNKDGWPDTNIDLDGDGLADTSIVNHDLNNDGICDLNCDTNNDGIPDINIDTNNDDKADTNIDTNNDGTPDINIDTNSDGICDLNCDTNNDDIPDTNIDTNNDGIPDINIDTNDDGVCDYNCDDNNDNVCDRNCIVPIPTGDENQTSSQTGDNNPNFATASLKINFQSLNHVAVKNLFPDDHTEENLNTKVDDLIFTIENAADIDLHYSLKWHVIENTFTSSNFWYKVNGNNDGYNQNWHTAPKEDAVIKANILIKPHTTQRYKISFTLHGTGEEQNFDQGKIFNGQIVVTLDSIK